MPLFRTILIDDHRLFTDSLRYVLHSCSHFEVVEQVTDSRFAYTTCQQHQPDLVLLDYRMPHLDGLAVVEQLRRLPNPPRIVILSLYAERREVNRFEEVGVDGFIAKTVAAGRLLMLLEQVMKGRQVIDRDTLHIEPKAGADSRGLKHHLSKREMVILHRVKQGLTTEQIAAQLGLRYDTVQTHHKHIGCKLPFTTLKEFDDFLETLDA